MKRADLIKKLEEKGWYFLRNGGNHDIFTNGKVSQPVPRHREIEEQLAKRILKRAGS